MARIRSVKPEFHADERLARDLTREQRLFYIGMWNEADDEGRLRANYRKLLGAIYPYEDDLDETFVESVLLRLADTNRAVLYTIGGERICQLTKFPEHQKVNHPTPSKLPPPPKKVASARGWLSGNPTGSIPDDSGWEVEVEVEVEQGAGSRESEGVRAREDAAQDDPTPNGERPDFDGYAPTDDQRARAAELHVDVDSCLRLWRAHRKANGREPSDLVADFDGWLEREPGMTRSANGNGAHPEPPPRPAPAPYSPPPEPESTPEQRAELARLAAETRERLRTDPTPAARKTRSPLSREDSLAFVRGEPVAPKS